MEEAEFLRVVSETARCVCALYPDTSRAQVRQELEPYARTALEEARQYTRDPAKQADLVEFSMKLVLRHWLVDHSGTEH